MDNAGDFGPRRKGEVVRRKSAAHSSRRTAPGSATVVNIAQLGQLFGAVGLHAAWTDALIQAEETGEPVWVQLPHCGPVVLLQEEEIARHAHQATDALLAATEPLGRGEALRLLRRSRMASCAFLDPR